MSEHKHTLRYPGNDPENGPARCVDANCPAIAARLRAMAERADTMADELGGDDRYDNVSAEANAHLQAAFELLRDTGIRLRMAASQVTGWSIRTR